MSTATMGEPSVETWSGKDRADENFPVGSALIRPGLRKHVHAYYRFARNGDDIADSATLSADDKVARLDVMEDVLLGRQDGGSPSALALRASLAKTGVSPSRGTDLLVAFRRDATKLRYANWDELYDYCRYSAMPVGLYLLDLHGESVESHAASDALCTSLQVLNHLQDCKADLANMDRCYLPQDLLDRHGASVDDLRRGAESPALRRVLNDLLDHCDTLNRIAEGLAPATRDRRMRLEGAVIVGLAQRLARRLRHGDPLATRVKLSKADMVASALASLRHFW